MFVSVYPATGIIPKYSKIENAQRAPSPQLAARSRSEYIMARKLTFQVPFQRTPMSLKEKALRVVSFLFPLEYFNALRSQNGHKVFPCGPMPTSVIKLTAAGQGVLRFEVVQNILEFTRWPGSPNEWHNGLLRGDGVPHVPDGL